MAAAQANAGLRSCAQRRRSCRLRATLWSCLAIGGPCTSGTWCRCIQAKRGRKETVRWLCQHFVSGKKDVFATMICPRRASPRRAEGSLRNLEWLRPRKARRLTITFASDAYIPRHRRFKRRACCADHGPAYYSRLNRLQARDCLLSVISPLLLVFHILSASPTSGRCDSRSHG